MDERTRIIREWWESTQAAIEALAAAIEGEEPPEPERDLVQAIFGR